MFRESGVPFRIVYIRSPPGGTHTWYCPVHVVLQELWGSHSHFEPTCGLWGGEGGRGKHSLQDPGGKGAGPQTSGDPFPARTPGHSSHHSQQRKTIRLEPAATDLTFQSARGRLGRPRQHGRWCVKPQLARDHGCRLTLGWRHTGTDALHTFLTVSSENTSKNSRPPSGEITRAT